MRAGRRFRRSPWRARRSEKAKQQAAAMATDVAAMRTNVLGFSCQAPDMAKVKRIAQGTFIERTYPVNRSISAPDFVRKMSRGLIGRPANARQSRRLGNKDCQ